MLFASSVSYMHGLEDKRFLQRQCWPQVAWEPGLCYGCPSVAAACHCTRAFFRRRQPSSFHPSQVQINCTKAVIQLPCVVSAQEFPFTSRWLQTVSWWGWGALLPLGQRRGGGCHWGKLCGSGQRDGLSFWGACVLLPCAFLASKGRWCWWQERWWRNEQHLALEGAEIDVWKVGSWQWRK